jgi:hypothetical protein
LAVVVTLTSIGDRVARCRLQLEPRLNLGPLSYHGQLNAWRETITGWWGCPGGPDKWQEKSLTPKQPPCISSSRHRYTDFKPDLAPFCSAKPAKKNAKIKT